MNAPMQSVQDNLLPVIEAFLQDQPHISAAKFGREATGKETDINLVYQMRTQHRRLREGKRRKVISYIRANASAALLARLKYSTSTNGHEKLELKA